MCRYVIVSIEWEYSIPRAVKVAKFISKLTIDLSRLLVFAVKLSKACMHVFFRPEKRRLMRVQVP